MNWKGFCSLGRRLLWFPFPFPVLRQLFQLLNFTHGSVVTFPISEQHSPGISFCDARREPSPKLSGSRRDASNFGIKSFRFFRNWNQTLGNVPSCEVNSRVVRNCEIVNLKLCSVLFWVSFWFNLETSEMTVTNIGMMRPCFTGYPFQGNS